jgi:hypothetical protein
LEFGGDLREFVGAAGHQDEIVMVAGEEFRQFVADAARGSGDECHGHAFILAGVALLRTHSSGGARFALRDGRMRPFLREHRKKKSAGESPAPT